MLERLKAVEQVTVTSVAVSNYLKKSAEEQAGSWRLTEVDE